MRVNVGTDLQALQMAGGMTTDSGTSTSVTATAINDTTKNWAINAWVNHIVVTGGVWGLVTANTATGITVDRWYTPSNPGGAAAAAPAIGSYTIVPGGQPAAVIALSTNATAPVAGDAVVANEVSNPGGGLNRKLATYSHTAGTSTYTLSTTFTANGSDPVSTVVNKAYVVNSMVPGQGTPQYEDPVPFPPTMVNGDVFTPTFTVSM